MNQNRFRLIFWSRVCVASWMYNRTRLTFWDVSIVSNVQPWQIIRSFPAISAITAFHALIG